MQRLFLSIMKICSFSIFGLLVSCATHNQDMDMDMQQQADNSPQVETQRFAADYSSRLPAHMNTDGKKMVYVDPNVSQQREAEYALLMPMKRTAAQEEEHTISPD
jgi:phage-related protein